MKTQHATANPERALLIGVTWKRARRIPGMPAGEQGRESLAELVELARSAGAEVAGTMYQVRESADPATLVATGWGDARKLIEAYVAAGISKFVIRPAGTPASLDRFVEDFAREMMPLQN